MTSNIHTCDGHYIYVAFITLRDGRKIYASEYGLKAFRIFIKDSIK